MLDVRTIAGTIYSNISGLERVSAQQHRFSTVGTLSVFDLAKWYWGTSRDDIVLITADTTAQIKLGLLRRILRGRATVIASDTVLPPVRDFKASIKSKVVGYALRGVDGLIVHHRDLSGYVRSYGIDTAKAVFVSFKVNAWETLAEDVPQNAAEEVIVIGRSHRDIRTFFAAARRLPEVPFAWLRPPLPELGIHGSDGTDDIPPPNVRVLEDDGSRQSFVRFIRQAGAVLIPVRPETISAAGLSTFLDAMALGKCVIMTDCPAQRDFVPDNCAVIARAGDADSLASAVMKVWSDVEFRSQVSRNGHHFAIGLEGEDRYYRDLMAAALTIQEKRKG